MICSPRGPLAVDYQAGQRFINTRLRGARRCLRRSCRWPNTLDRDKCWQCGGKIATEKVVRISPSEKNGHLRYEISLEFLDLDEDHKEWIISYVFQMQREAIRRKKKE